jgi:putative N6-adenine-specific DNA methylase
MAAPVHTFRVAVAAGLEPAAQRELASLGIEDIQTVHGAVLFRAPASDGALATLALRCAARVSLVLLRQAPVTTDEYFEAVSGAPWDEWLEAGKSWAVRVFGRSDALHNELFTARWTKDAIVDRFARRRQSAPPVDPRAPEVTIEVRLTPRGADLGLALADASLHRRGFERRTAAPLREDVAAGLALLAGASADQPLVDPFCGSATLLGEAAAVALRIPPVRENVVARLRAIGLFRDQRWLDLTERLRARRLTAHQPFLGFDADPKQIAHARRQLEHAGLTDDVVVRRGVLPSIELEGCDQPGLVLTNPPWGRWLEGQAEEAWSALGAWAKSRLPGWKLWTLSGADGLTRPLRMKAERRYPVRIGTVDARLIGYSIRNAPDGAELVEG